jgi:hypothetical protein
MKNLVLIAIAAVALFMGANQLIMQADGVEPATQTVVVESTEAKDSAVPCPGCESGCTSCSTVSAVPCPGCEAGCTSCNTMSVDEGSLAVTKLASAGQLVAADMLAGDCGNGCGGCANGNGGGCGGNGGGTNVGAADCGTGCTGQLCPGCANCS